MGSERNQRLDAWWQQHRAAFSVRERERGPSSGSVSPRPLGDAFEAALRAELPEPLRATFRVPPDFARLVSLLEGRWWQTADAWHELWSTDIMVANLALEARVHDDVELVRSAGAWVQFARSGDHGHFFISCDSAAAHFGTVIEGDDDHPWLEGGLLRGLGRAPLNLDDALPLADWLDRWRAVATDDPDSLDGPGE